MPRFSIFFGVGNVDARAIEKKRPGIGRGPAFGAECAAVMVRKVPKNPSSLYPKDWSPFRGKDHAVNVCKLLGAF